MTTKVQARHAVRLWTVVLAGAMAAYGLSASFARADGLPVPTPRGEGWLVKSYAQIAVPAPSKDGRSELSALKAITAKRTAADAARFYWWAAGGPVHRWNEIILDEMQTGFVTLPLAVRHLALFQAALDDAVAAARHHRRSAASVESSELDAAIKAAGRPLYPSEYAAAAAAAADVLGYLFPGRAAFFAQKADEAIQARLLAGVEYPHESATGRSIGQSIAALAIARGKSDKSDGKWTGAVPQEPNLWKGTNPIAPIAATWRPWVLTSPSEFRPLAPPAVDSDQVKSELRELKSFARTPKSNHRAVYWEVHGGARAHTLWNDVARTMLLEYRYPSQVAARVLTALNIALVDAGIACWDAKYAFWYIRPSQLDPEVKALFAAPNHPSYPSAHGCFSTAAATVLADVFPQDRDRLLALGREAGEARIWAGIHYRFDVEAGEEIGRRVAKRTLERAFSVATR